MILINPRKQIYTIEPIGETFYVSPTGSGSQFTYENPGDAKAGLALAQAGDTVMFLDGEYMDTASNWEHAFNVSRSGTAVAPITLKSYNPRGAVFLRRLYTMPALATQNYEYIVIDGVKTEGMLHVLESEHVTIKNSEVTKGSLQDNISLHWGLAINNCANCLIQNNWVHLMDGDLGNHGHNSACIMVYGSYTQGVCHDNIVEFNTVDGSYPGGAKNNVYSAYGTKSGYVDDCTWRYNFGTGAYCGWFGIANSADTNYNENWSVYQNIILGDVFFYSYNGARDHSVYNNTFVGTEFLHRPDYPGEVVRDRNFKIFNNLFVTNYYIAREISVPDWPSFLEYSDYNRATVNTAWGWTYGVTTATLPQWRTLTGKDGSSSATAPNFVNLGGTTPEDYKRTSYPTDGRGGSYSNVMGAYISGSERIGCDFTTP
jgi:hypothetical protein